MAHWLYGLYMTSLTRISALATPTAPTVHNIAISVRFAVIVRGLPLTQPVTFRLMKTGVGDELFVVTDLLVTEETAM